MASRDWKMFRLVFSCSKSSIAWSWIIHPGVLCCYIKSTKYLATVSGLWSLTGVKLLPLTLVTSAYFFHSFPVSISRKSILIYSPQCSSKEVSQDYLDAHSTRDEHSQYTFAQSLRHFLCWKMTKKRSIMIQYASGDTWGLRASYGLAYLHHHSIQKVILLWHYATQSLPHSVTS